MATRKGWLLIDGQEYKVIETMGYNHDAGAYGKIVQVGEQQKMAVSPSRRGPWRLWGAKDRVAPLVQHLQKMTARQAIKPEGK